TCPQPVVSAHLPDGAAAGGRPGAPQYAGAVPTLARPCCLAPVSDDLAADGVGGLRQAAAARAAAGPALPGPLHASCGHHESAAPRLRGWPGDVPVEGLPAGQSPTPHDA